jgi:hypothetical protein
LDSQIMHAASSQPEPLGRLARIRIQPPAGYQAAALVSTTCSWRDASCCLVPGCLVAELSDPRLRCL